MKLRALSAATILLASVLVGAPGATATAASAPAGTPASSAAASGDQAGADGINRGTREWVCRNLGFWCD